MSVTKEQADFFWTFAQDNAAIDGSDVERFAEIAGSMVQEAKDEIDRLTKERSSQISASTKNNHMRVKELEDTVEKLCHCLNQFDDETEDFAWPRELIQSAD
ncbi:hypothetical protein, partial [Oenococcus oeni]|uniref:hypothetical protein n=1 Tax=Oenococcus oeni TaxID=1247 RepID=UPI00117D8C73